MRNFLNKKDLLRRVLVLLKSKHQFLQLSALRFLRKIIGLKDEQYNLTIVRSNLLAPVVEAFKINKRRYNLFNSALIELFEFIRHEDIQILINYFIENFYGEFHNVSYVKTFHGLKLRYDTHRDRKEHMLSDSSPTSTSRYHEPLNPVHLFSIQRHRKDERELDVDEENWFNDDVDDNPIASMTNSNAQFDSGSDDDDSQSELTANAMSTSAPIRSHPSRSEDDDDDRLSVSSLDAASRSHPSKPVIHIQIRRSPTPSSSTTASHDATQMPEPSSTYVMSPSLSSIADQYNDEDDEDEDEDQNDENHVSSLTRKRQSAGDDDDDDKQTKIFKRSTEQS